MLTYEKTVYEFCIDACVYSVVFVEIQINRNFNCKERLNVILSCTCKHVHDLVCTTLKRDNLTM